MTGRLSRALARFPAVPLLSAVGAIGGAASAMLEGFHQMGATVPHGPHGGLIVIFLPLFFLAIGTVAVAMGGAFGAVSGVVLSLLFTGGVRSGEG